tara:strand:+ start:963 stop:1259 length:297 start_codon:yes stop_codon:yes gene_type:complete
MIKVTVELVSAVHPSRSRVLGSIEICNDGSGGQSVGHYYGTLHAEYTGRDGRKGEIKNFNRQQQSAFSLVGAFLKHWGHTKHSALTPKLPEPMDDPLF